jgi:two-component system, LytTR family, sensor histidine kinase AlgZ
MEPRRNDVRPKAANTRQILARKEIAARTVNFPELRNSGILARALVLFVGLNAAYAVATTEQLRELPITFVLALALSLPVATAVGLVWLLASKPLRKLAYWQAAVSLCLVGTVVAWIAANYLGHASWKTATLAAGGVGAVLAYFHTLGRALSPAVTEARLQALQARIRPHFLFNAINGVLGVLRYEPKRAENALEDLAELFRALMKDNKEMRSLHDEIVLTRQYLDLEKLRLGSRLSVEWRIDKMPSEAMVPALILQPIAENAVYHGIEPSNRPGLIEIEAVRKRNDVIITVCNPFVEHAGKHHGGNKMAMGNIRERLALHFDAEARMVAGPRDGRWQVQIVLPYVAPGEAKSAL